MAWGTQEGTTIVEPNTPAFGREYYETQFTNQVSGGRPIRMSLVGKENTTKTGNAVELALKHTDKEIVIFDIDASAENTVLHVAPDAENIRILSLFDEADDSIFNDDNTTNWLALVDKVKWFASIVGKRAKEGEIGAVIFDGASTFMKWCEFVMTESLLRRGVIKEEGDGFNQKEWRERNRLFRDVIGRIHALPVPNVFFTFHLKDIKEYIDLGNGQKGLSTIGQKVDWVEGTQRYASQQLWLTRYTQKGDRAAGVKADSSLKEGDWVVKCRVEEMKGRNMEHLGKEYTVLEVNDGKPTWSGLPFDWL